jgi:hypothetical protein
VTSPLAITSVNPNTVYNDVDTEVTVTVSGFSCATGIMLGTTDLTTWSKDSDTQVTATIPAGITPGTYHTIIKTNIGNSPQTSNDEVTVSAP